MTSQDLVRLRQFDQELREHFQSLRQLRGDRPLFLIEHGLDEIRLSDLMRHVGAQARLVGLGALDWLGASLSLAVFITEVGYGYRGNGTEFWPRVESELGVTLSGIDRRMISDVFGNLHRRLGTAAPHDSDWARKFNIIAWPVRNALAPLEIHRPLALALGRLAASGGHNLPDEEFRSRLVAIADGLWSRRLSDWLHDSDLTTGLGRSLLFGEEFESWIEPRAAARIRRDIRMDGECRQILRGARRIVRSQSGASGKVLPSASWIASVVREDTGYRVEKLLLRGPVVPRSTREAVCTIFGKTAVLEIAGGDGQPVFLDIFLQGEMVALDRVEASQGADLLHLAQRAKDDPDVGELVRALQPPTLSLFRWHKDGGLLQSVGEADRVHPLDWLLHLQTGEAEDMARPAAAISIAAPAGMRAWIAPAEVCRSALVHAGASLSDHGLVDFLSGSRILRHGNRIIATGDAPLLVRACVPGVEISLGESGKERLVLEQGGIALIPLPGVATDLEISCDGVTERHMLETAPAVAEKTFGCQLRPPEATLDDLLSGEAVVAISAPLALDKTSVVIRLVRNGRDLAECTLALSAIPARIAFSEPELKPLRAAAFDVTGRPEDAHWTLSVGIEGFGRFDFPLRLRRSLWSRKADCLTWIGEDGTEVGAGLVASDRAPLPTDVWQERDPATMGIKLWLPDIRGDMRFYTGVITGCPQLFGGDTSFPDVGMIGRAMTTSRVGPGVAGICEAMIAWRTAQADNILADASRRHLVQALENKLVEVFCGSDWLKAERELRGGTGGLAALLADEAIRHRLASGGGFPPVARVDRQLFRGALGRRFAEVLPAFEGLLDAPAEDDPAALLDEAVNRAYDDLSAALQARGEDPLEETDAGSDPADWWAALSRARHRLTLSPLRRLVLPETRWGALVASRYDRLSDDDLIELLMRVHLDISRQPGVEWIGPAALRSGLMLWLSPVEMLETDGWQGHLARLLSDRHTARAIRYVALRSRGEKSLRLAASA